MTFSRIDRVNELIKTSLAKHLAEDVELPAGVFSTVSKVDTTRDLRYAKVFLSIYPEKKSAEIFRILKRKMYQIQGRLNKQLDMKPLPRIEFIKDTTEAKADKIEQILKDIAESA